MHVNKLSSMNRIRFSLILAIVVIIGVGWFICLSPKREINNIKSKINTTDKKIARGMHITQNLESLRQEHKQKQKLLPLMQKVLPAEVQTTEFLSQVLHSASGLDIDFLSIGKPEIIGGQNPTDILQRVRLELSLRGSFPNLINYLDKLRRIHRLFDITNIQIRLDENIAPEVKVDLTVQAYAISPQRIS